MESNNFGGSQKLPNDPSSLVLVVIGILGIILSFCCSFVGVIVGVIGFVLANKSIHTFEEEEEHGYIVTSYKQMKTAKILNIIAIVLGVVMTIYTIKYWDESVEQVRLIIEEMEG